MRRTRPMLLTVFAALLVVSVSTPGLLHASEDEVRRELGNLEFTDATIVVNGEYTVASLVETLSELAPFEYELEEGLSQEDFVRERWETTIVGALVWLAQEKDVRYEVKAGVLHVSPAS